VHCYAKLKIRPALNDQQLALLVVGFGLASVRRGRQWKIFGFNLLVSSIFSVAFELI
jgi:hypothetical protein